MMAERHTTYAAVDAAKLGAAHVDEFLMVVCLETHLGLGGKRLIEQCLDAVQETD